MNLDENQIKLSMGSKERCRMGPLPYRAKQGVKNPLNMGLIPRDGKGLGDERNDKWREEGIQCAFGFRWRLRARKKNRRFSLLDRGIKMSPTPCCDPKSEGEGLSQRQKKGKGAVAEELGIHLLRKTARLILISLD